MNLAELIVMTKTMAADSQPSLRIFRMGGAHTDRFLSCAKPDPDLASVRTIADLIPVTEIMTRNVTCASRDLSAALIAELMVREHIGCVPVVEEPGRPIGMITKLDLVEQLLANDLEQAESPSSNDLRPKTANELMMPLAITLGQRATVAHAAALMASEDVHHTPIVDDDGRLIGIVSTMDIVRWLAKNDGFGTS